MYQLSLFRTPQKVIPPRDPSVTPEEAPRLTGQNAAVFLRLRRGPATNKELSAIALKYTSRISDLRERGFVIECFKRGWIEDEVNKARYEYGERLETGEQIVVGVNAFKEEGEEVNINIFRLPSDDRTVPRPGGTLMATKTKKKAKPKKKGGTKKAQTPKAPPAPPANGKNGKTGDLDLKEGKGKVKALDGRH